jgi:hypothetical protein
MCVHVHQARQQRRVREFERLFGWFIDIRTGCCDSVASNGDVAWAIETRFLTEYATRANQQIKWSWSHGKNTESSFSVA